MPVPLPPPGPLLDAQRALSLVRSQAEEWGIDPHRIGIVGFSAGGHLAVAVATSFETRAYEPIDAIDRVSCRPDFAAAVYPGYLVRKETGLLAEQMNIRARTPPVFLVHASDDSKHGRCREQRGDVPGPEARRHPGGAARLRERRARLRRAQEGPAYRRLDGRLCRLAAQPRRAEARPVGIRGLYGRPPSGILSRKTPPDWGLPRVGDVCGSAGRSVTIR
jgi:acetyl esterase/lipase